MNKSMIMPFIVGAVVGAIALAVAGFNWGGWMSGSAATKMANEASIEATVAALTPDCVAAGTSAMSETPDQKAEFDELRSYSQRGFVEKAGWSAYPDGASSTLKRAMDTACAEGLSES